MLGDVEDPSLYEYGVIARHLLAGHGYSMLFPAHHPSFAPDYTWPENTFVSPQATPTAFTLPGYVFVMYVILGAFGNSTASYIILYLINVFLSPVAIYLLFRLTTDLLGSRAGRWAVVLAAVYPPFIASAVTFGGTIEYHVVMLLALWSIERLARVRALLWPVILSAVLSAVWISFRAEGLVLSVLAAVIVLHRRSLSMAALFIVILATLLSPWTIRNTLVFDRFVPMTNNFALNLWRGNNADATGGAFKPDGEPNWYTPEMLKELRQVPHSARYEIECMDIYKRAAFEYISTHPLRTALLYVKKVAMFFSFEYSDPRIYNPVFLFSQGLLQLSLFAGTVLLLRKKSLPWLPVLAIMYYALVVSALHLETRYQLVITIMYFPIVAAIPLALAGRLAEVGQRVQLKRDTP
jgi:hypothetical protein